MMRPLHKYTWLLVAALMVLALLAPAAGAGPVPLTMQVIEPADGITVVGVVPLKAKVTGKPTSVTYQVGTGGPLIPLTYGSYTGYWTANWDSTTVAPGVYTLYFRASDGKTTVVDQRTLTVVPAGVVPWPHPRGDIEARAAVAEGPGTNLKLGWERPGYYSPRFAVKDGVLYLSTPASGGEVAALDAASGKAKWSLKFNNVTALTVGNDAIYFSQYNTAVYALRPDGTTLWTSAVPGVSPVALTDAGLLVGDNIGTFYALDPATGATVWTTPVGGSVSKWYPIAVGGGRAYASLSEKVAALDLATGAVLWENRLNVTFTNPVYDPDTDTVYVGGDYGMKGLDPATGAVRWTFDVDTYVTSSPVATQGMVIFIDDFGIISALDGLTGAMRWQVALDSVSQDYGDPVAAGGLLYAPAWSGGIRVFDVATGQFLTTLLPDGDFATPTPSGNILYIPNNQFGYQAMIQN